MNIKIIVSKLKSEEMAKVLSKRVSFQEKKKCNFLFTKLFFPQ